METARLEMRFFNAIFFYFTAYSVVDNNTISSKKVLSTETRFTYIFLYYNNSNAKYFSLKRKREIYIITTAKSVFHVSISVQREM